MTNLFTRFSVIQSSIANPDGVGLGLSIVKNIVDRLSGDIALTSSQDGIFTVKLISAKCL